jgi:hypothetical protein
MSREGQDTINRFNHGHVYEKRGYADINYARPNKDINRGKFRF